MYPDKFAPQVSLTGAPIGVHFGDRKHTQQKASWVLRKGTEHWGVDIIETRWVYKISSPIRNRGCWRKVPEIWQIWRLARQSNYERKTLSPCYQSQNIPQLLNKDLASNASKESCLLRPADASEFMSGQAKCTWSLLVKCQHHNNCGAPTVVMATVVVHTLWYLSLEYSSETSLGPPHGWKAICPKTRTNSGEPLGRKFTDPFSFCGLHTIFLICHLGSKVCELEQLLQGHTTPSAP